ncbi:MAG: 3-deoxy-7-phosphoheptulonate synthase, partial [Verrucomicrobiota bacterium]
ISQFMNITNTAVNNVNIHGYEELVTIDEIRKRVPMTDHAMETIVRGRDEFIRVLKGEDKRFAVVVGPCSIHDPKAALTYAESILEFREKFGDRLLILMRVYFEKPRTSIGWKGLVSDPHLDGTFDMNTGLVQARRLLIDIAEKGVPTATELLDPVVAAYLGELVSWVSIGARTTESQTHRQMASGLSAPVGLKNGTDGSIESPLNAMVSAGSEHAFLSINDAGGASIVRTNGNPWTHLILRGAKGATGYQPNFDAASVADIEERLKAKSFTPQVMIDCSHANSLYDHERQTLVVNDIVKQKTAGNESIFGLMLESNINPGKQKLNGPLCELKYGVSVTDACVGLGETEEILTHIYQNLRC